MTFPASTQTQADALTRIRNAALNLKRVAKRHRDQMAAGNIKASAVITVLNNVRDSITTFDEIASVPGIDAYAQAQYDDVNLDVSAEFSAMRLAAVSVRDWITTNLPSDTNGFVLLQSFDDSGRLVWRTFTPTQTAGLRAELDALIATIG